MGLGLGGGVVSSQIFEEKESGSDFAHKNGGVGKISGVIFKESGTGITYFPTN